MGGSGPRAVAGSPHQPVAAACCFAAPGGHSPYNAPWQDQLTNVCGCCCRHSVQWPTAPAAWPGAQRSCCCACWTCRRVLGAAAAWVLLGAETGCACPSPSHTPYWALCTCRCQARPGRARARCRGYHLVCPHMHPRLHPPHPPKLPQVALVRVLTPIQAARVVLAAHPFFPGGPGRSCAGCQPPALAGRRAHVPRDSSAGRRGAGRFDDSPAQRAPPPHGRRSWRDEF